MVLTDMIDLDFVQSFTVNNFLLENEHLSVFKS